MKAVQTSEGDQPTITSLHKATYGMLLFGIPHKGLLIDDMHKMLAGQDEHPRTALLSQIRRKPNVLAIQLADFKNLIRDRKIVSFYEIAQTRQLQFVWLSKFNIPVVNSNIVSNRTLKPSDGEGRVTSSRR